MERAAAGQAALRHPSPAAAGTPAQGWRHIPSSPSPSGAPGKRLSAAADAAALNRIQGRQVMLVTGHKNGLLLRRTCLTVAAPPRKAPSPSGAVRLGSKR